MFKNAHQKKIKKDYQHKNLKNPFFRRPKSDKPQYITKLYAAGGILAFILLFWFLFFSFFWNWDKVVIEGLTCLPSEEIEKIVLEQGSESRWLFFRQSNIFVFDDKSVIKKITDNYNFAGLDIKKTWPRTITVKISERPYSFIWQEGGELCYASGDAYAIKGPTVSDEDQKKYPILENKTGQALINSKNKINLQDELLDFFLDLNNELNEHPELEVEKFIIDSEFNTLQVKFLNGPVVYFNTRVASAGQLTNLLLVKNAKIKDNFSKTNYIDLRYGDKIFINPEFSN